MTDTLTIECDIHFDRQGRGSRKVLANGPRPHRPTEPGRVPRVARLMALAIRFGQLLREGVFESYTELAALGHVSRARISQIMNLLNLAPDIQEAILFLPRRLHGRDPIHLRQLQPIAAAPDWRKQRRMWGELLAQTAPPIRDAKLERLFRLVEGVRTDRKTTSPFRLDRGILPSRDPARP